MTETNTNQIVWELKDGKVFIRDQVESTTFGLKIEFSATNEGFRDTLREYRVARHKADDNADREYFGDVAGAIRHARDAWQRANNRFTEGKPVLRSRPLGEKGWDRLTLAGFGVFIE